MEKSANRCDVGPLAKNNKTFEFNIQKFGLFKKNKPQTDAKDAIKDRFIK